MTAALADHPAPGAPISMSQPRSPWRESWQRLCQKRLTRCCLAIVGLYMIAAGAAFTPLMDTAITRVAGESYQMPSLAQPALWLGTDILGRSVFWRLLYGARVALTLAVLSSVVSIAVGTTLGVLAGYVGGWVDNVVIWLFSTVNSVPWILLAMTLAYALKGEPILGLEISPLAVVVMSLGLTSWVGLCRLIRAEVMKLRDLEYVTAAKACGVGPMRILTRHLLPNVFHLVIITFSLMAVDFVQAEVALAFLGLGISDRPSWGRMIDDAKSELLRGVWWQLAGATFAIFLLCLALNLLGDALRDALDPRLRERN